MAEKGGAAGSGAPRGSGGGGTGGSSPTAKLSAEERSSRSDELLAEYMQRIDSGEKIDREVLLREHPDYADELAEYFEAEDAFSNIFGDSAIRAKPALETELNVAMVELVEEETVDALDEDTETFEDARREAARREATPPHGMEIPHSTSGPWRMTAAMLLVAILAMAGWSVTRLVSRAGVAVKNPEIKSNTSPFAPGDEVWEPAPGANWSAKNRPGLLALFDDDAQFYAYLLADGEKIRFGTPDESYSGPRCLVSIPAPPTPAVPAVVPPPGAPVLPAKKGIDAERTKDGDRKEADKKDLDKKALEKKEPDKRDGDKRDLDKKDRAEKKADKKLEKKIVRRLHPMLPAAVESPPGRVGFRYLRFAWKKSGGEGILVRLIAADGRTFVYYAGEIGELTEESVRIAKDAPTEWTVVERDVAADFGPFSLSAIVVSSADGPSASFDHIYLARTVDLLAKATPRNPPPKVVPPPTLPTGASQKKFP